MNNFKKHDVVMIATNKASTISKFQNKDKLEYSSYPNMGDYVVNRQAQHLCITSDDEIKEGDWYLTTENTIHKKGNNKESMFVGGTNGKNKKIIATTDNSLTEYTDREVNGFSGDVSLPQIPKSFVEHYIAEYNKGNVITKIMVEYEETKGTCDCYYTKFCKAPEHLKTGELCKDEQNYNLKVNPDNTINIKPIKDSWNREEVVQLLLNCCGEVSCNDGILLGKTPSELVKWIEQNL
jgi:hypothetical protein